MPHHLYKSL